MAEFTYADVQEVATDGNVLLNDSIRCAKGLVMHRDGSGILTLRGPAYGCANRFARYKCTFNGNIAIPTGGTAGEISLSLAIGGEALQSSLAAATPTVVGAYFNVTSTANIDVPSGCCVTIAVENTSGQPINVRNANLTVDRTA